jgi:hypothetical protein
MAVTRSSPAGRAGVGASAVQPSGPSYWQQPNPVASVFNADHRAAIEFGATIRNDRRESSDDVCGTSVTQTEDDDLPGLAFRQRRNFAEIEVERQKSPIFLDRFGEDLRISQSLQRLLSQMDGIVSLVPKPADDLDTDSHVR